MKDTQEVKIIKVTESYVDRKKGNSFDNLGELLKSGGVVKGMR